MLKTAIDLTAYQLAAGEPFLLEIQLQEATGAVMNLAARAFVLAFYGSGRSQVAAIDGEKLTDATGLFLRFARDGQFSDSLFGQDLTVEFAERYKNGRNVITTGKLTVLASAGGVQSLDDGVVGQFVVRITMRANASSPGTLTPSQQILPYQPSLGTPAPTFTTAPSITRSGSRLTGNDGVIANGAAKTREWLLDGTVIASGGTYDLVGTEAGQITYRVLAEGAGGTVRVTSAPISVTATVTKVTITGTPPTTGQVGTALSFTPATAGGSGTKAFALSGGSLLAGLVFSASTGAITGKPTTAGSMTGLVITVTDSTGSASLPAFNVTIAPAQPVPAFAFSGPATIAEGNPSPPQYGFAGPATIVEGN